MDRWTHLKKEEGFWTTKTPFNRIQITWAYTWVKLLAEIIEESCLVGEFVGTQLSVSTYINIQVDMDDIGF